MLICPCGAKFEAIKGGNWLGPRKVGVYVCAARRRKGPTVCTNDLALPITEAESMILDVIDGDVLAPAFVTRVLDSAFAPMTVEDRSVIEVERARVAREIENLSRAIAVGRDDDGNEIPTLVAMLKDRDKRLKVLDNRLAPRDTPDRQALLSALLQRVTDWRGILRSNPKQGRVVLQQLVGEIRLHSTANRPHWLATPRPAGLLVGLVQSMASPTGFEPDGQGRRAAAPGG